MYLRLIGLAVVSVCSLLTLPKVKVNGPSFQDIALWKDVSADTVPPTQSLVAPDLFPRQAAGAAEDKAIQDERLAKYTAARKAFEAGMGFAKVADEVKEIAGETAKRKSARGRIRGRSARLSQEDGFSGADWIGAQRPYNFDVSGLVKCGELFRRQPAEHNVGRPCL
jgi:hypothetical protein